MVERRCRVLAADTEGVRLLPEPAACEGCGGCGGRCALVPSPQRPLWLPRSRIDAPLHEGGAALLYLDERALLAAGRRGYGMPLLGLTLGALGGHGLASAWHLTPDLPAVLAALAGTLLGVVVSKRSGAPPCRVRPVSA